VANSFPLIGHGDDIEPVSPEVTLNSFIITDKGRLPALQLAAKRSSHFLQINALLYTYTRVVYQWADSARPTSGLPIPRLGGVQKQTAFEQSKRACREA
jgi:hypothetical protein